MKGLVLQNHIAKEKEFKKIIETGRNDNQIAIAYINLITLYINNKDYINARAYLNLAKENIKNNNNSIKLMLEANETTLLISENKYLEAEQLINKLLPQCNGILNKPIKNVLLKNLEEIRKQKS